MLRPLALALIVVGGCTQMPQQPIQALDSRSLDIENRKEDVLRQLAQCESGGNGDSDRPIYGAGGAYVGRFQFSPRTVIGFVRERDGRTLSHKEAVDLAHDYRQAAQLAKWAIFERDAISHWPLCNRKHGLAARVAAIKAM
ncbi:MAG TPA: hypothetical protein VJ890_08280 [Vineibacter sp.]|nr:hypothetical protein [Vineibacter sp.]